MQRFHKVFKTNHCAIIGMIHVKALPGTPKYDGNFNAIIEQARCEANIYKKHKIDAVIIENMHDNPYIQETRMGPEIVAAMTRMTHEVKQILSKTPCGIQIVSIANKQALAVAKATNLQFIRAEGYVFAHIGDEGYTDACAGELLRYRKQIDAENVLVLTDLKKKHSSHAITNDISLLETVQAAEFFNSDGIIITGTSTGVAVDLNELKSIYKKCKLPILMGSGVTCTNITDYFFKSNAAIIGSYFKKNGHWTNEVCEERVAKLMEKVSQLKETAGGGDDK